MSKQDINPVTEFGSDHYTRHNQRRLEHLATLDLPLAGRSVIEVGAGIGDHTSFFLDRGCSIVASDGRPENVELLRGRHPSISVRQLDVDDPDPGFRESAEVVYCYGTLYHLQRPGEALVFLADRCTSLMLVETCVSFGDDERLVLVDEDVSNLAGSPGYRLSPDAAPGPPAPHRPYVYMPRTQPWHEEFPVDWTSPPIAPDQLIRAIYVASRDPLQNRLLTEEIPQRQER